ncbi:sensor histidine kinase [Nitrososphaera sp.]|uniref:sensor histidine kinase n=1 Tax=Nitrososphaera sp. TaxID=1971748 RepID=UPI0017F3DC85|nr:sensor histidine kinase [Nitrososphaera sp.]NWG37710.1 sensor histidine kinase [Nitrososphaera sp.]
MEKNKGNLAGSMARQAGQHVQTAIAALEVAADMPQMQSTEYSDLISEENKGVPVNVDMEKRNVQKAVLLAVPSLESIGFLMPNGDVYSVEPSILQQNLPVVNFAYRDYYIEVINRQNTYVSAAFQSTATYNYTTVIAVPVFKDGSLAGLLVGALNLGVINEQLRMLDLDENEVAVIVDGDWNEIASSDRPVGDTTPRRSFSYLQDIMGDTAMSARIDASGKDTYITRAPVDLGSNRWSVLLIQPYSDAFSDVYLHQSEALSIIAITVGIMSVSGYILFRSMLGNVRLTDKLEDVNEELKTLNQNLKGDKARLESLSSELKSKNEHLEYLAKELDLKATQLKEMDAAKEEFAAMITHELKTPLVPIVGYTELLVDGTLGELTPVQKEKIQLMHDSAVSLSGLISDLLDIRKLEMGKMKFDVLETPVKDIVGQAVGSFLPLAKSKQIALTYTAAPDGGGSDLMLSCDPKRIQQVLNNLISNSLKFVSEKTGVVQVTARRNSNSVEFAVKDNGIGIPEEKQARLFSKFYQVDTSLRREVGGSGLGLAISKGIVEAHGGKIWFESTPRVGSTFYFSIPMVNNAVGGAEA